MNYKDLVKECKKRGITIIGDNGKFSLLDKKGKEHKILNNRDMKKYKSGKITDDLLKFYHVGLLTIIFRKSYLKDLDFIYSYEEDNDISEQEIYENDFDICNVTCSIKIFITYENISVKGTEVVTLV